MICICLKLGIIIIIIVITYWNNTFCTRQKNSSTLQRESSQTMYNVFGASTISQLLIVSEYTRTHTRSLSSLSSSHTVTNIYNYMYSLDCQLQTKQDAQNMQYNITQRYRRSTTTGAWARVRRNSVARAVCATMTSPGRGNNNTGLNVRWRRRDWRQLTNHKTRDTNKKQTIDLAAHVATCTCTCTSCTWLQLTTNFVCNEQRLAVQTQ